MSAVLVIGAFKAAFEFLSQHRYLARFVIRWSIQPLLTVVFLIGGVGFISHYAQKDSALQDLMTAFFGSPLDILAKRTAIELAVTQAQIGVDANANRVIDQVLTGALERVNTGSRLRFRLLDTCCRANQCQEFGVGGSESFLKRGTQQSMHCTMMRSERMHSTLIILKHIFLWQTMLNLPIV